MGATGQRHLPAAYTKGMAHTTYSTETCVFSRAGLRAAAKKNLRDGNRTPALRHVS
jgi:hypothetical protein